MLGGKKGFWNIFTGKLSSYSFQSLVFPPSSFLFSSALYQYLETRYNSNLSEAENSIAQKVYRLLPPHASSSIASFFLSIDLHNNAKKYRRKKRGEGEEAKKKLFLSCTMGVLRKFMTRGVKTKVIFLRWVSAREIMSWKFASRVVRSEDGREVSLQRRVISPFSCRETFAKSSSSADESTKFTEIKTHEVKLLLRYPLQLPLIFIELLMLF